MARGHGQVAASQRSAVVLISSSRWTRGDTKSGTTSAAVVVECGNSVMRTAEA